MIAFRSCTTDSRAGCEKTIWVRFAYATVEYHGLFHVQSREANESHAGG